ncbi:odorant receptor Or1-like [Schistocerca gregaria]|uniref:odorant receptor Or1-like n=1 Tax=Schistocerca gregaria TaxID=7010 RepID=UPI00211E221C|nr:odorant receptor Or1-like [Schistocerca gregaria]
MGRPMTAEAADRHGRSLETPGTSLRRLLGLWQPRGRHSRTVAAALTMTCLTWLSLTSSLKLLIDPPVELEEVALCSFIASICTGFLIKASVVPALIGWIFFPLISHALINSEKESSEASWQFPVAHWIPANMQVSPAYEILYVVQSFCLIVASQSTNSIDLFFIHMMLMVAAELEVLSENVSAMKKVDGSLMKTENGGCEQITKEVLGHGDGNSRSKEDFSGQDMTDHHMYVLLVKNVRHHQAILKAFTLLQETMDKSIFILLFVNMADLCSCVFATAILLQRGGNVAKALKPLITIPPCLYETVMYCFFGNIVTDKSEDLLNSAYSCGWADCDTRFRRGLVFFVTQAMRPLEITVGKMCKLSKQMLLQVLNGSYMLLNLLYSTS